MTKKLLFSFVALLCVCTSAWAQKIKGLPFKKQSVTSTQTSNTNKVESVRSSKYWGSGTYYCYAPGVPNNKLANNAESRMRNLIGLLGEDYYKEIAKQGFCGSATERDAKMVLIALTVKI